MLTLNILAVSLFSLLLAASGRPFRSLTSRWPAQVLRSCEAATNCAVIGGEPRIDRALTRRLLAERDDSDQIVTRIVADSGTVDKSNCVPGDIIQQTLNNNCLEGDCTHDAQTFTCPPQPEAGVAGLKETVQCTVTQDGQYASDDQRAMLIDIVQAAARAHTTVKSNSADTITLGRREAAHFGRPVTFNTNVVPKSIVASYNIGPNSSVAHMRYTISCQVEGAGECDAILNNVGAIVGMILPETKALAGLITKGC